MFPCILFLHIFYTTRHLKWSFILFSMPVYLQFHFASFFCIFMHISRLGILVPWELLSEVFRVDFSVCLPENIFILSTFWNCNCMLTRSSHHVWWSLIIFFTFSSFVFSVWFYLSILHWFIFLLTDSLLKVSDLLLNSSIWFIILVNIFFSSWILNSFLKDFLLHWNYPLFLLIFCIY